MFVVTTTSLHQISPITILFLNEFSQGFWYGVIVTLVFGVFFYVLGKFWKKIQAFFKPTKVPATNSGASPAKTMNGCIVASPILLIVFIFAVLFLVYVF